MDLKDERYDFPLTNLTGKKTDDALVIDVRTASEMPLKGMGLIVMGEDEGTDENPDLGHAIKGYMQFKYSENLRLAQMGLELIKMAWMNDLEMSEDED